MKSIKPFDEGRRNYVSPEKALENIAKMPKVEARRAPEDYVKWSGQHREPRAYRKEGRVNKELLTYDQHIERLKRDGWIRAPSPQEVSVLLIQFFGGSAKHKPDSALQAMISDLTESPEFLCHAVERSGNRLLVYEKVVELKLVDGKYAKPDIHWYRQSRDFRIPNGVDEYITSENSPRLFEYFYTRKNLPEPMAKTAHIFIPTETDISPLTIRKGYRFESADTKINIRCASRGIR